MLEKRKQSQSETGGDVTQIVGGIEEALREKIEVEKQHLAIDEAKLRESTAIRKELERRNTFLLHLSSAIENIDNTLRFSVGPGLSLSIEYQKALSNALRVMSECLIRDEADEQKLTEVLDRLNKVGNITINAGTNISSGQDTNISSGGDTNIKG